MQLMVQELLFWKKSLVKISIKKKRTKYDVLKMRISRWKHEKCRKEVNKLNRIEGSTN